MKKIILIILLFISFSAGYCEEVVTTKSGNKIIIYDDNTWSPLKTESLSKENLFKKYDSQLRKGIKATKQERITACQMISQGWVYTMPSPKSSKAGWGVSDGRTTWYLGWWHNNITNHYSSRTPKKTKNNLYLGDNQNNSYRWRNGGSPRKPDIYMFLLSKSGGPQY